MKIIEADVVWTPKRPYNEGNPNAGTIRVEKHGSHWQSTPGNRWMPAAEAWVMGTSFRSKGDPTKQLLSMFILFNTIIVRDRIPADAAHEAFLQIDEYRGAISPDAPGADT